MHKNLAYILVVLGILLPAAFQAQAQDYRTIAGKVSYVAVDDPTFGRGLTKDERRYAVRVGLSTVSGTLLGFGDAGEVLVPYRAMLDLLLLAMEHNWTVNLRVDEELRADRRTPTHLRIVTVTIGNPAMATPAR